MKKRMKRYLALLLSLVMCLNLFSFQVFASGLSDVSAGDSETGETERTDGRQQGLITASEVYINPLYADVIEPSDLNEPGDSYNEGISTAEADEYSTSIEEAGAEMRSYLKAREGSFEVGLETTEVNSGMSDDQVKEVIQAQAKTVALQAMEHTGDPEEGDYLKWQYAGWKCSTSCRTQSDRGFVTFKYTFTYYTTRAQEDKVDAAVEDVLSQLNLQGTSEYYKLSSIYDYICSNVTYDYDNLENDDYKLKYTAYAALINKTAVCQGFAVLLYRFAMELHVDARLIAGTGKGESHAWNIAKIDKKYYDLDSTWDAGKSEYSYFLKCDANFGDHIRSSDYKTDEFNAAYPMSTKDYVPRTNDTFEDISVSDYYYEPVLWAKENNITSGVDATHFAPEDPCTRGQVVTFLWRAAGEPEVKSTDCPFTDVYSGDYYYNAVLWAYENDITSGTDATHFAPDEVVTRGQFVTFLHRAEGKPGYTLKTCPFEDVSANAYYKDAIMWAYENEITSGVDAAHFAPEDSCNRGQVVTFLYRAFEE